MSDPTRTDYITLKTEWIDMCHDIGNLQTIKKKFPEDESLKEKLKSKEGLKEVYEVELEKRRPLRW